MSVSRPIRPVRPAAKPAAGRGLFGGAVQMVLPAHSVGERPKRELPTVVVLGRSNVGKSSLLNALLGASVARVSQTPGRTQALYWYRVDDRIHVVDCPGYGFAKTSREARERFTAMIEALLEGPPKPEAALLLVDGRLEPQESDRSMALYLREAGVPCVVAATKWDAVRPAQRPRRLRDLAREYQDAERMLQPVSAETGENLPLLVRLLRARVGETIAAPSPKTIPATDSAPETAERREP